MKAQLQNAAYDLMLRGLYKNTVEQIHPKELDTLSKPYVLLDTREKAEFDVSHLKGALFVGYNYYDPSSVKTISRDVPVIVYCSVGYRSERIGEKLKAAGFQEVYNLYGGIFEWINEGFPVVNNEDKVTNKVHAYSKTWGIWLQKGEKVY